MKEKIKKVQIHPTSHQKHWEDEYLRRKNQHINEYQEYIPGGFLSSGYYKKNPLAGEAEWNGMYPKGIDDWARKKLTSDPFDVSLELKVNEIIDYLNKKK